MRDGGAPSLWQNSQVIWIRWPEVSAHEQPNEQAFSFVCILTSGYVPAVLPKIAGCLMGAVETGGLRDIIQLGESSQPASHLFFCTWEQRATVTGSQEVFALVQGWLLPSWNLYRLLLARAFVHMCLRMVSCLVKTRFFSQEPKDSC